MLLVRCILFSGLIATVGGLCDDAAATGLPRVPYSVPATPWSIQLGNHRAIVHTKGPGGAVYVRIPWRRRDEFPEKKRIVVVDSASGTVVKNVLRIAINREYGDLLFEPPSPSCTYYVYYLPYKVQMQWGWYEGDYLAPEDPPDAAWLASHRLSTGPDMRVRKDIPQGVVAGIQARTQFDSFFPMEVPATSRELAAFKKDHPATFLLFPEDRSLPIRMRNHLPLRWTDRDLLGSFAGTALRNEYYAFQVGVYASRDSLDSLSVEFSPLVKKKSRTEFSPGAWTCFNLGGTDARGKAFMRRINVASGVVQPLWFGLDVPREASAGEYAGFLTIRARNAAPQRVRLSLRVLDQVLEDRGDGEPWRHSRLRWLNSTAGSEPTPVPPYPPVRVDGKQIEVLGRRVEIGSYGLPDSIWCGNRQILSAPVTFSLHRGGRVIPLQPAGWILQDANQARVCWTAMARAQEAEISCSARMEFDGYLRTMVTVRALQALPLEDLRLTIPLKEEIGEYMIGIGKEGCRTPDRYVWKWNGPQDSFWFGNTIGGIHCELRGGSYHGPLLNLYHPAPPPSWENNGLGGCAIDRDGATVTASAFSGARTLAEGDTVKFEFALLITPVKLLDTYSQFHDRYYHAIDPRKEDLAAGIRIMNVHHGYAVNPCINYPFLTVDTLRRFVDRWHREGMKVKIYYTVRELTNAVTEIWALRSLGTEVLAGGEGGGYPWLREHLEGDYTWAWYNPFPDSTADAAVVTSGESRWYNYYIEGLAWLARQTGIDGLYLDDVTYDREILQRMKRVLARARPEAIFDLHSNTGFSIGPANQYAEFFPYIDKLWFGESFQYDRMPPENWLVEVSGIPFGLMGDMLQGGGNPWRGMVFGMTVRHPWVTDGKLCDPRAIWGVWDRVGIERSTMVGYWDPRCPVRADRPDVLATVYAGKGEALVAVASWAPDSVQVNLRIDYRALGIDSSRVRLIAPSVKNFQPEREFNPGEPIPVAPAKGWLIIVR